MKQQDRIRIRLQWHKARVQELIAGGMDAGVADRTAYGEAVRMKNKDLAAWDRQQEEEAQKAVTALEGRYEDLDCPTLFEGWSLGRHGERSDYGPDAYTLWPYGAVIHSIPRPAAALIDAGPRMFALIRVLASVKGPVTIRERVMTLEDGTQIDLGEHIDAIYADMREEKGQ